MDPKIAAYLAYLAISVAMTVWVARTLFRNGRVFLVDVFHGNDDLADSVNHLLVVGFYLLNLGFIALALVISQEVATTRTAIEVVSTKVGLVLLALGAMHFLNLLIFSRVRRAAIGDSIVRPPRRGA